MQSVQQRLEALGISIPEIMFPKAGVDLQKWAVIACDQFTQDRPYWTKIERFTGNAPSTLNLIFPEIYLGDPGKDERIQKIHQTMKAYAEEGIFTPPNQGLMYLERSTPYQQCRRGLVLAADLEQYEWKKDAQTLIRATEGTVEERLPPRMAVRRGASLECSHVLLLIDDEKDVVLSGLGALAKAAPPVYQTPLTAGAITGWFLNQETDWLYLAEKLEDLAQKAVNCYGSPPFLYAVGDGNHSLASAKAVWEEYKTLHAGDSGLMQHPGRYALVEVENLYDPGITFEPIHRLMLGATLAEMVSVLEELPDFTSRPVGSREELAALSGDAGAPNLRLGLIAGTEYILAEFRAPGLVTDHLQPLLDAFIAAKGQGYNIDYIHGQDALFSGNYTGVGILLPGISKRGFFKTVARRGPLPRKSFSMGEAEEKRFYLECRRLF